jgi:hypothetical protein
MLASLPRVALTGLIAITFAACTGAASSPADPSPSAVPPVASPSVSPSPSAQTYWLRMTTWQAIPPLNQFASQPLLVIAGDGMAVTSGPVPAIYPGPLLPNLIGRPISQAGLDAIVQRARDLGLLDGTTDFTPDDNLMGGVTGRIELTVDGMRVTLTGSPDATIECITTPCEPAPGTPEAFGELWRDLLDLPSLVGAELGPEAPYQPGAYALLVTTAPQADPSLPQQPAVWPLDQPLGSFGGPVANGTARCGTVSGSDADTLRPALEAANQLTPWVDQADSTTLFGLTVRPLVPGEDACTEIFGA